MRRIQRVTVLLAIVLLFSVCIKAFNKIGYNTLLPRIVLQRIDSFFDLTSAQESYLKTQIALHHKWHRATQLKLYLNDLKDLRQRFSARLSERDLDWLIARLTLHRNALFARVLPDIVNILQTLSEAQIAHLEKKLATENKELAEKLARPLPVRQEEEFKKIIGQVEDWAGNISDSQKEQLRARYMTLPDGLADWLRYREDQQAVFIRLLRAKPDHQTLVKDLEARMIYQERNVPKRFKASFTRTMTLLREMILTADRLLTPEQRAHVIAKADEYLQLIGELTG
jgi:hypothetical protein